MAILPVLDLKNGQVVHGVGGRRDTYRPVVSVLTQSSQPCAVAQALHRHFGFAQFYLADLDAIGGSAPARPTYDLLHTMGFRLWVDAGVRTLDDARRLAGMGVARVIVGLETVQGPQTLSAIVAALGSDRVVFSLDLQDGQPLGDTAPWATRDPEALAQRALAAGVTHLLVLDLARVGAGTGAGTEVLCARLREAHDELEITAGGGVRGPEDITRLTQCGVDYVLVASALHDGRLTP